jgi:hypothetical protein
MNHRKNAGLVIDRLLNAISDLELMPGRFRLVGRSRKRGSPIHARVVRPFLIYYRIDQSPRAVWVVEVRHGARRQPRSFE